MLNQQISSCFTSIILYFALALLFFSITKAGELDSTEIYKVILQIDYFNDDAAKDTLIGAAKSDKNFFPRFIHWGIDTTSSIPDSLKVAETEITYPTWNKFGGACNLDKINQDTLADIILYLWGDKTDTTQTEKDTAIAVVIFGQHGLDTLSELIITEIDTFQYEPYVAMHMRMEHEFTDSKYRDLTYKASYIVNDIDLDTEDTSGDPPPKTALPETPIEDMQVVKIYPNPAVYYTNLEINTINPGNYIIQILNMNSRVINEQQVSITTKGELFKTLDLKDMATGYYMMRIFSKEVMIGIYQILVVH